jgi:hypothetical protein
MLIRVKICSPLILQVCLILWREYPSELVDNSEGMKSEMLYRNPAPYRNV